MPDGIEIIHGDAFLELPKLARESVDMVFTDAPYVATSLGCYGLLAREARRVLKRGGYCFAYCGKMFFPEAIVQMRRHLDYFWFLNERHMTSWPRVLKVQMVQTGKPVLIFTKGKPGRMAWMLDECKDGCRQKKHHPWEQDIALPLFIFQKLCRPGELVLDPFAGSGTTLAAAALTGMRGIGIESDAAHVATARERLANFRACPAMVAGCRRTNETWVGRRTGKIGHKLGGPKGKRS